MRVFFCILVLLVFLMGSPSIARDFPTIWGVWTWNHYEPVHVVVTPGCYGQQLSSADYFGGIPVDGTIRIQVWIQEPGVDPPPPYPLANFPGEDIWLEIPGTVACMAGAVADGPTDSEGWVTFSQDLDMGGWNDPEGSAPFAYVLLNGIPLYDQNDHLISPDIVVNSSDINGDLASDLVDLALFASDYFGNYSYRSDLFWDGVVNLADLATFALYYGCECD
jgi:hypothetical protein